MRATFAFYGLILIASGIAAAETPGLLPPSRACVYGLLRAPTPLEYAMHALEEMNLKYVPIFSPSDSPKLLILREKARPDEPSLAHERLRDIEQRFPGALTFMIDADMIGSGYFSGGQWESQIVLRDPRMLEQGVLNPTIAHELLHGKFHRDRQTRTERLALAEFRANFGTSLQQDPALDGVYSDGVTAEELFAYPFDLVFTTAEAYRKARAEPGQKLSAASDQAIERALYYGLAAFNAVKTAVERAIPIIEADYFQVTRSSVHPSLSGERPDISLNTFGFNGQVDARLSIGRELLTDLDFEMSEPFGQIVSPGPPYFKSWALVKLETLRALAGELTAVYRELHAEWLALPRESGLARATVAQMMERFRRPRAITREFERRYFDDVRVLRERERTRKQKQAR